MVKERGWTGERGCGGALEEEQAGRGPRERIRGLERAKEGRERKTQRYIKKEIVEREPARRYRRRIVVANIPGATVGHEAAARMTNTPLA